MMYPAVLLLLATGVVIFLLVFFIPRFQTLFAGFDAALPLITRVIVGASDAPAALRPFPARRRAAAAFYFGRNWLAATTASAALGKRAAAHAGHRPAGRATRHGALLPDARHAARARASR